MASKTRAYEKSGFLRISSTKLLRDAKSMDKTASFVVVATSSAAVAALCLSSVSWERCIRNCALQMMAISKRVWITANPAIIFMRKDMGTSSIRY